MKKCQSGKSENMVLDSDIYKERIKGKGKINEPRWEVEPEFNAPYHAH